MISLRNTPFKIDFAGNNPRFDIRTEPYVVSPIYGYAVYSIYQLPYISGVTGTIVLTYPDGQVTREIVPANISVAGYDKIRATTTLAQMADRLFDRFLNDTDVMEHYEVDVTLGTGVNDTPCCLVRLSQKDPETEAIPVITYQQNGVDVASVNSLPTVTLKSSRQGRTGSSRQDYLIRGRYLVRRSINDTGSYIGGDTGTEYIESPEFCLCCDGDNATIDTRLLKSYFNKMDIPPIGETFAAYAVRQNIIKYRLRYGAEYEGIVDEYTRTSSERLLLNGMIEWNNQVENVPDWDVNTNSQISTLSTLINWGAPKNINYRIFEGCELFVYIANFTGASRTATLSILSDEAQQSSTLTIDSELVRIPIGTDALPQAINPIRFYKIQINDGGMVIYNINVELMTKPYFSRVLLLQNHVGLAETFICDSIVFERETSGNEIVLNDDLANELTDSKSRLTIRTGYRTKNDMRLLADAFTRSDNYMLQGNLAYPINFIPGTLTAIDESEDLQSAEVQITLGKPIQRVVVVKTDPVFTDDEHLGDNYSLVDPFN